MANTKNQTKKVNNETSVATAKVNKLDAIASKLQVTKVGRTGSSIYKASLFEGQDKDAKKAIRRKVRRIRDQFLGAFLEKKGDAAEMKALQKEWKEFAGEVYNNVSFIFEKNTKEEDQKLCQEFTKAMAMEYK